MGCHTQHCGGEIANTPQDGNGNCKLQRGGGRRGVLAHPRLLSQGGGGRRIYPLIVLPGVYDTDTDEEEGGG